MTGRPAAFSALALASTASVADSEIADTRAETLVGMGSILAPAGQCPAAIYSGGRTAVSLLAGQPGYRPGLTAVPRGLAVRRGGVLDVHCLNRQPSCRMRQHARRLTVFAAKQFVLEAVVLKLWCLKLRAVAQLARVPVSKTGGWGFESLLPCECGPAKPRCRRMY
jgi:hypothetical protein